MTEGVLWSFQGMKEKTWGMKSTYLDLIRGNPGYETIHNPGNFTMDNGE
jgi:hypothetical protein